MMNYRGVIYRQPVEARTILLPVTEGCSHNKCVFCSMYSGVPFRMLPLDEVEEYLREISSRYSVYTDMIERIYLVGADPFVLSAVRLEERADLIRKYLPSVKVITMYARVSNVINKSDDDLNRLKAAGINDLYVETECGLDDVLSYMNKGNSV